MKKIVSLLSTFAIVASLLTSFAFTAEAAVEKPTFTLKFGGYTTAGTSTVSYFPAIEVWVEFPFELEEYTMNEADWETTFEDTYSGKMIQTMGCDVDLGSGFGNYVASKSSANTAEVPKCVLSKNANTSRIQVTADAGSGSYDTYYAGVSPVKLATIVYRVTDPDATNTVSLTTGTVTSTDIAIDGTATPTIYAMSAGKIALGSALTIPSYNDWSTPVVKEEVVAGTGAVAGDNATEGKYDGKYLKHIATILEDTALSKYVSISDGTETKVSTRTVAEILGGISVNNTSVSGKLAIGVLTDNENAVFTFELIAPAAE